MNVTSSLRPVSVVASVRSPDDQQRLSDLIGIIYDAAIDPSVWECAIEKAAYTGPTMARRSIARRQELQKKRRASK